ncbi:MAG TPA: sugar ABC transporter permease [Firmicutes bacterium]|nr:sugar ABC transporter permease [Bacillota bacterium]HHY97717.1 sugar ABC transporter permease [Bacillota bacterium]
MLGGFRGQRARNLANGLLFISPWIIGFLIFTIYPIAASFYYSFTEFNILQPPDWVGLAGYKALVFEDPLFWISIKNTLFMLVFGLPPSLLLALFLAVLLNQNVKGKAFFRTVFYLPSILPAVATAMLWMWIFNPQYGLINVLLKILFGIEGPGWLVDARWSKPAFVVMGLWGVGGSMVIFLAGLQSIPQQLYEAAEIDGANAWNQFWNITFPMLSPTVFFNLIMGTIGMFQYFTAPYIMTRGVGSNVPPGSPLNSTLFYALYLFQNAFAYFKMGYASAMAWILFLLIVLATIFIFRSSARWVYYEGR